MILKSVKAEPGLERQRPFVAEPKKGYDPGMGTAIQPSAPTVIPAGLVQPGAKQGRPLSMPLDEEGTTAEVRIINPNGVLTGLSVEHVDALVEYFGIMRKRLERKDA